MALEDILGNFTDEQLQSIIQQWRDSVGTPLESQQAQSAQIAFNILNQRNPTGDAQVIGRPPGTPLTPRESANQIDLSQFPHSGGTGQDHRFEHPSHHADRAELSEGPPAGGGRITQPGDITAVDALPTGGTTAPAQQTDQDTILDKIVSDWKAGVFGNNTESVVERIMSEFGITKNEALGFFNDITPELTGQPGTPPPEGSPEAPGGTPTTTATPAPATADAAVDALNDRERLLRDLSGTEVGRGQLFREAVSARGPLGDPSLERFRRESFAPFQDLFTLQRGLGQRGEEDTFDEFLPSGRIRPPGSEAFTQSLQELSQRFGGTGDTLPGEQQTFLDTLRGNASRQFDLGFRGVESNIPSELREGTETVLENRFGRASEGRAIQEGLGFTPQSNPFSEFINQGTGFTGPSDFRSLARNAANLISGQDVGIGGSGERFREKVSGDPKRQFNIAVQARRSEIPFSQRAAFDRIARRAFDAFQARNRGDVNPEQFLPFIAARNFRFGGL